jgi:hypothetical protein
MSMLYYKDEISLLNYNKIPTTLNLNHHPHNKNAN